MLVTSSPLAMSTWALSTMPLSGSTLGVDGENMEDHLFFGDDADNADSVSDDGDKMGDYLVAGIGCGWG